MKYIKYIIALLLLFFIIKCYNSSQQKINPTEHLNSKTNVTDEWYVGGNLHKSKIREWKAASERNKLATCADFVANIKKDLPISELKTKAIEMKNCIDEATKGTSISDDEKTNEIAALCVILLKY